MRYDTISFLSDFGTDDEFVGVVHSVVRAIAPEVAVVDVSHAVPPFDVRAGSLMLARAAQYLCPGVVLGVVDPGVGTDRPAVAIEVGDGASVLVGPDNGLFAPAVALVGGATRAVRLTERAYHLPHPPGPTFAGRDIFGPVAAHLCLGTPLEALGPEIDVALLRPGLVPLSEVSASGCRGEVLWADRYGNAQLNIDPADLEPLGERLMLRWGDQVRVARRVDAYAELATGEIGVLVDSYGLAAIVVDRGAATADLGIDVGAEIEITIPDDQAPTGARPVRVELDRMPRRH